MKKYPTPKLQITAISTEDILSDSPGTLENLLKESSDEIDSVSWNKQ